MLRIENLSVSYGRVRALSNISFELKKGNIMSVIGSNGAGKTTLLNSISGLVKKTGRIFFEDKLLRNEPYKIVKDGIVQVPEGRKIFMQLTVEENLRIGAYLIKDKKEVNQMIMEQYELFPILEERKKQYAGMLSGGEQQMLAIARGMMSKPKILLLDEPSLGLAPIVLESVFKVIEDIKKKGVTILLVEQNAVKALSITDYAFVIENGKITHSGKSSDLRNDPSIVEAYLGTRKHDKTKRRDNNEFAIL